MFNSAAMCRQQEAHHRQLAANATLENTRRIALIAATAWGLEADAAESREQGSGDNLSKADAAIALEFKLEDEAEQLIIKQLGEGAPSIETG